MRHVMPASLRIASRAALAALLVTAAAAPIAAAEKAKTTIDHKPIKYFVGGKRIRLEATVKDPAGIAAVRCYFRAMGRGDYVFTTMEGGADGRYRALLPAPVATTTAIQYRIQAVNLKGETAKSTTFMVERKDDAGTPVWQEVATDEIVRIGEGGASAAPDGFGDAAARTTAKTSSPSSSSSSSAARSASSAKTGLSKGAWLGIGAGAAAVGAGAVLLAGGGGDEEGTTPCNQAVNAGGDTPEQHRISLGQKSGTFGFSWDMQNIKDRMLVIYGGNTIFDTGCVSGTGSRSISFSGGSSTVTIDVRPNCSGGTSGTWWQFTVACP